MHRRCVSRLAILSGLLLAALGAAPGVAHARGELRAISYNIKHAELTGERLNPLIGSLMGSRPDVVALQEVDQSWGRSGNRDQAGEIAAALGMHHRFFPTVDCVQRDEARDGSCRYGLAILSRWPIAAGSVRGHALPVPAGEEFRMLARLVINWRGRRVEILNTHLSRWPAHPAQIRRILSLLPRDDRPLLLMGDFTSATFDVGWLRGRLVDAQRSVGSTTPTIGGRRLDYIFASRSLRVVGAGAPAWALSDHSPVLARIRPV
jgi:endonuclease/exonuclease/phosphatase family metal-dependent hydrolase